MVSLSFHARRRRYGRIRWTRGIVRSSAVEVRDHERESAAAQNQLEVNVRFIQHWRGGGTPWVVLPAAASTNVDTDNEKISVRSR
jgi:hypothetical protein